MPRRGKRQLVSNTLEKEVNAASRRGHDKYAAQSLDAASERYREEYASMRSLTVREENAILSAPAGDLQSLVDYVMVLTNDEHVPSYSVQARLVQAIVNDWPRLADDGMWSTAVHAERRRRGLPVRHPDERRAHALLEDLRIALGRSRDGVAALTRLAVDAGRDAVYVPDRDLFARIVTAAVDPGRPEMLVLLSHYESLLSADVKHAQQHRRRVQSDAGRIGGALDDTILGRYIITNGRAVRWVEQIVPLLLAAQDNNLTSDTNDADDLYLRGSVHVRLFGLINAVFPASASIARAARTALSATSAEWRIFVVRELLDQCSDLGAWPATWRLLAAIAADHFGHPAPPDTDASDLAMHILGIPSDGVAGAVEGVGGRTMADEYEYLIMLVSGALWCLFAHPTGGALADDAAALSGLARRVREGFAELRKRALMDGAQIDGSVAWADADQAIAVATQAVLPGDLA